MAEIRIGPRNAEKTIHLDQAEMHAEAREVAVLGEQLDAILSALEAGQDQTVGFLVSRLNQGVALEGLVCAIVLPSAPVHEVRIKRDRVLWYCEHEPERHEGVVRR